MDERKWPLPRPTTWKRVLPLFREFHGYGDAGRVGQVWACFEGTKIMAAFTWAPPPPGVALLVSPSCRAGALALSRMVAVPKEEREWHISKPLKWIMKNGIDRERYPVLVTFADTGEGHSGHVYVCSGWQKDGEVTSKRYGDPENPGVRKSQYLASGLTVEGLELQSTSTLIRFVHPKIRMGARGNREDPSLQ